MVDENLFADVQPEEVQKTEESTEFTTDQLSDRPAGQTYERVNLSGQTVVIKDARLFGATKDDPVTTGTGGKAKYKKCKFMIYYETPNEDREGLSGAIQFLKPDGTLQPPSIFYEGNNQAAQLFQKVAGKLGKKPEDLSMAEFMRFLKSKPKAKLIQQSFTWQGKTTHKNMVDQFI